MSDLVCTPWKRYGHRRVYVGPAGGPSIGHLDEVTDLVHVTDEADRPRVLAALGRAVAVPEQPVRAHDDWAVVVPRLERDLADSRPGGGAAEKAKELRQAAPVRSRVARLLGVHTDERAWRVGAEGERVVGGELDRLGPAWVVLHDLPVGDRGANIDHVAIGPGGVFTVNSKYHWDKRVWAGGDVIMVEGRRQPYVRNARHEAARAARLLGAAAGLPVVVTGVVAIVSHDRTVKSQPADGTVLVLGPRGTRKHLAAQPVVLDVPTVQRLAMAARRASTWAPPRA